MTDPNLTDIAYKFEHFFELSPDLLCIAGFDGYFKRINPAVSKVLGYTNEELTSRPIIDFVFPDDREITILSRQNLSQNTPLINFENRYLTKDGDIVWLYWTSMPAKDEQLIYAVAKNVTHKKQLEEDRNRHLANLTKINQDLKHLTFTTSHDLRSPVNNLLSIFNLLDASKITDRDTMEYIGILRSATENLSQTLNKSVDILIQKNGSNVLVEELTLRDHLNVVLRSIQSLIKNSDVTISADFSHLEKVKFNKGYLESIFLNLITNSIKYAQEDHPAVISIRSRIDGQTAQLIIEDNGLGFDIAHDQERIFGLSQKFHYHSDSKGIGLYLVHNHITSLGGKISVESKVNEGTKFTISFRS